MGITPQFRKRKFNKTDAPNPNNKKVKNEKTTIENVVNKVNTEKPKENNIAKATEIKNDLVISEPKPIHKKTKKTKSKIADLPAEEENDDDVAKAMKMKFVEMSNEISESDLGKPKAKKAKKNKTVAEEHDGEDNEVVVKVKNEEVETSDDADRNCKGITEEMITKYPILKDEEVIKKFQAVGLTNNQKGRIRSQMRQKLRGTSEAMLPDAINTKIQAVLKEDKPNWMKVRVLFNMLKTALKGKKPFVKKEKLQPVKKDNKEKKLENGTEEKAEQKVKGPKRYVVFIGNLALDITKEKILEHFSDLSDKIKSVRIPKPPSNKKSAIAYLEVADELTYELALSKHHTMLDNRRINVLYSTQKDSKISKAEAKGKAAKLVAMQKSGQLAGSEPLSKKRSARRKKMKLAQKKAQEAAEPGV